MVFWCACPGSIPNRNRLGYSSAYPGGALAFLRDIPWVYSAGYSCPYLGMAWKNVASPGGRENRPATPRVNDEGPLTVCLRMVGIRLYRAELRPTQRHRRATNDQNPGVGFLEFGCQ
jgi:hypothetical protein